MRNYRAIPIGGKDFVYGGLYELANGMTFIVTNNPFPPSSWSFNIGNFFVSLIAVIPETVSQATGKENVYEGDKIKSKLFDGVVKWLDYSFRVVDKEGFPHQLYNATEIEIVGNIFDNLQ